MLYTISRLFNKTPVVNSRSNFYEINSMNFLKEMCNSKLNSEGVYGIEQITIDDYSEEIQFTPKIHKLEYPTNDKDWSQLRSEVKSSSFYEINMKNKMFLPLDHRGCIQLLDNIKNFKLGTLFLQILFCKRVDDWREVAISQYSEYLKGNDSPSANKIIRSLQSRFLYKLRNSNREPIDEIESKILSQWFRFEIRIILFDRDKKAEFEMQMNNLLEKMSYYNVLELNEVSHIKEFQNHIFERKFQFYSRENAISEHELYSLLGNKEISSNFSTKIEKPIKRQSTIKTIEESMLVEKAIQILPFKESKQKKIDNDLPKRINNAFRRVGVTDKDFKVIDTYLGTSLLKVQMEVPKNIVFTSIKKKLEDIQAALGNKGVSIEIGQKPDTVDVYLPLEERDVVYFRKILDSDEFKAFSKINPLPFIIGENVNGGFLFGSLSKFRHLLIAGTSGSGKSVFMTLILLCLLLSVPPDELDMYLIDPKMVELTMFAGFPQVKPIIKDMKKATLLLEQLCIEMDRRYELMSEIGVKEIAVYNKKADVKIPYAVVGVDEFADLIMVNSSVEDYIVRIAQKGRAAGIHLILATQRPSVDVVTGLIKANMPVRIAFKTTSGVDSKTILDTVGAEKLLGLGDGLAKLEGSAKELERFQAPVLTLEKEDEEVIYDKLKELFKEVPVRDDELPEVESEEEPIDKLKKIIATHNETRISELQKLMGIRINAVSDLVKELVEEGWLEKQGRGYEIVADEVELTKWRE